MNEYAGRCETCGEPLYERGCYNCGPFEPLPEEPEEEDRTYLLEKELERLRHEWKKIGNVVS